MRTSFVPSRLTLRHLEPSGWLRLLRSASPAIRDAGSGANTGMGFFNRQTLAGLGVMAAAISQSAVGASVQAREPQAEARPVQTPPASTLPAHTLDVPVGDFKLHVRVVGNPRVGTPILAMPGGFSLSHQYMRGLEKLATPDRAFVVFDPRGVGGSTQPADSRPKDVQGPPRGWTLDAMSGDIEAVRKAVGAERVILVGHSASGMNVMDYATRFPQNVAALVLLDSVPPSFEQLLPMLMGSIQAHLAKHGERMEDAPPPVFGASCTNELVGVAKHWYANEPSAAEVRSMLGGTECHEDSDLRLGGAAGYDLRKALAASTVRVIVVTPELSLFKGMSEMSAAAFPKENVTRVPVPGVGHALWAENEEAVLDALRKALESR